ncbi:hypothetical protein AHF37_06381 [Paragonimus kellicotti]|nr:hypothetical protein AHF37_06381 [Paragonimus kellicotti]
MSSFMTHCPCSRLMVKSSRSKQKVRLDGPVESWLCDVEEQMYKTLREMLRECRVALKKAAAKRDKFVKDWPGQLCITTSQIQWTSDVTRALQLVQPRLGDPYSRLMSTKAQGNRRMILEGHPPDRAGTKTTLVTDSIAGSKLSASTTHGTATSVTAGSSEAVVHQTSNLNAESVSALQLPDGSDNRAETDKPSVQMSPQSLVAPDGLSDVSGGRVEQSRSTDVQRYSTMVDTDRSASSAVENGDKITRVQITESTTAPPINPTATQLAVGSLTPTSSHLGPQSTAGGPGGKLKHPALNVVIHDALSMFSLDGEEVPFKAKVRLDGPVESWLCDVEEQMYKTLREMLRECRVALKKAAAKRDKFVKDWPGQLCITTSQIQWTSDVTRALQLVNQRQDKKPLKSLRRKQREPDDCFARQTNTCFQYGYEYLGNSGRLVITPLTDRCYITLTTALHLHRGGSPKGPAGTGKTETVKDLGKALGDYVIVVNCSEGLDYKSMGRMFAGLAQTGAWGCFDEFNRINIEVLSVVAQQILSILSALSIASQTSTPMEKTRFMFDGRMLQLVWSCGIFITMNPGYAGRTELPDNLKSMFRPIAMVVPDSSMIAEITLFAEGFGSTKLLAKKVFALYNLTIQQLSKQDHYDFGLRALVSVLRYAGRKKRANPTMPDEEVLLMSLNDMNLAKLTSVDLPLFKGIMADLFPGVETPTCDYTTIKNAVEAACQTMNIRMIPFLLNKVIQLYETKSSRHSVMLVGKTLSGKSTTWRVLQRIHNELNKAGDPGFERVQEYPLNPKSLSLGELYGEFNLATNEWTDGVLSSLMRQTCVGKLERGHLVCIQVWGGSLIDWYVRKPLSIRCS